jgi:transposase
MRRGEIGERFPNRDKSDSTCWLRMEASMMARPYSNDLRARGWKVPVAAAASFQPAACSTCAGSAWRRANRVVRRARQRRSCSSVSAVATPHCFRPRPMISLRHADGQGRCTNERPGNGNRYERSYECSQAAHRRDHRVELRRWSWDQKQAIVEESLSPHASAAALARKHGIGIGQLYTWRRQLLRRQLAGTPRFAALRSLRNRLA